MNNRTQKERYYDALIQWCILGCNSMSCILHDGRLFCVNDHGVLFGTPTCEGCPYNQCEYLRLTSLNCGGN